MDIDMREQENKIYFGGSDCMDYGLNVQTKSKDILN